MTLILLIEEDVLLVQVKWIKLLGGYAKKYKGIKDIDKFCMFEGSDNSLTLTDFRVPFTWKPNGNLDIQSICGHGTSDYPKITGTYTNSLGMKDTERINAAGQLSNGEKGSINFWGIENWYGDIYECVDDLQIANDKGLINVLKYNGEVDRTIQSHCTLNSYNEIKKIIFGKYSDIIPDELTSNDNYNTYFSDNSVVSSSTGCVASRSDNGAVPSGGLAKLYLNNTSSNANDNISSQLLPVDKGCKENVYVTTSGEILIEYIELTKVIDYPIENIVIIKNDKGYYEFVDYDLVKRK